MAAAPLLQGNRAERWSCRPSKCDTQGRFGTNLPNSYWLSEHEAETKGHGTDWDFGRTETVVLQKLILISQRPCFTCREVPPSVMNLIKSQVYYLLLHMRYSPIHRHGLRSFGLGRGDKYRVKKTSKYRVWKLAAAIMSGEPLFDSSSYLSLRDDVHVLVNARLLLFSWNKILHCHYSLYCRGKLWRYARKPSKESVIRFILNG